ncbi:anti-sigma factor [Dermacoccaceae bacterium W4C1]
MNSEIYQLLGAYAVDAVSEQERAEVEAYLATHPEELAEVRSLQAAAGRMSALTEVPAPQHLRAQILGSANTSRPLPPSATPPAAVQPHAAEQSTTNTETAAPAARPHRSWRSRGALITAAALVIGGIGLGTKQWWQPVDTSPATVAADVTDADDDVWYGTTLEGHEINVIRSVSKHAAVVKADQLPSAGAGKTYQVWLQHTDGSMSPAGLLPSTSGDHEVLLKGDAASAVGIGITIEPAGGSPQPTSSPVATLEFST